MGAEVRRGAFIPNGAKPENGFVGAVVDGNSLQVRTFNGSLHDFTFPLGSDPLRTALPALFSRLHGIDPQTHWRTIGIAGLNGIGRDFAAETWLQRGVPTILFDVTDHNKGNLPVTTSEEVLSQVVTKHTPSGMRRIEVDIHGQIFSSRLGRWTDYEQFYPEAVWRELIGVFQNIAKKSRNRIYIDDNTTEKAGGVAGMNHPKQRFIDDYNETERAKIADGEEGYMIDYRWMKKNGRIDSNIAAEFGIDLQDPELLKQYGEPDPDIPGKLIINVFKLTKKRHVMLQDDAQPGTKYTAKDDALYHAWSKTQYLENLRPVLVEAQAQGKEVSLKLEDQQTWGQLQYIREDFPQGDPRSDFLRIIARNHIHSHAALAIDPKSPIHPIVQSILGDLSYGIDLFMVHRSNDQAGRDEFIFRDAFGNIHPLIADKVAYAEASFDEMDGLGRLLTDDEKPHLYAENNYNLVMSGQSPDDFSLPGIGIYARDDESKDKITGMLAYARFAKRMLDEGFSIDQIPNYRDIAMGASDDPSGERINAAYLIGLHPELAETIPKYIQDSFDDGDRRVIMLLQTMVAENPWLADKIKKYRFSYDEYEDRNRRAIEETCEIAGQYSTAEACEDQISRWIAGGVYVVVPNVGGMPTQIEDGISGKIIYKTGDDREIDAIAAEFYRYFMEIRPDEDRRELFRQQVKIALKPQYTTLYNIVREFGAGALVFDHKDQISVMVQQQRADTGHFPFVLDLLGAYKQEATFN